MTKPRRRWLRRTLIAVVAMAALLVAFLLATPLVVQMPAVKAELESRVSKMVQGRIGWKSLRLSYPFPRAVLRDIEIDIPGSVRGRIALVEARLHLSALLRGHAVITGVVVKQPDLQLKIAASPTAAAAPEDPITAYRSVMRPLARAIPSLAPDMVIVVEDGRLGITVEGGPDIQLSQLAARGRTQGSDLSIKLTTSSNWWKRLQLDAQANLSDLRAQATLEVSEFGPQTLIDRVVPQPWRLGVPAANLRIEGHTDARAELAGKFQLDVPSLQVARKEGRLDLAGVSAKGTASYRDGQTELVLSELSAGDLLAAATAHLQTRHDLAELTVEIPRLDLAKVRDAVIDLAVDEPDLRGYAQRLHEGTMENLRVSANAASTQHLFDLENLAASLDLAQVSARLPFIEWEAARLSAHAELLGKRLTAHSVSATLGDQHLSDGSVSYSLADDAVFASTSFDLDLNRTLALVRTLLEPEDREKITAIRRISGRAQGHGQLSIKRKQWNASIAIARSDGRMESDWLPWPAAVKAGNAAFSADDLKLDRVSGSIGGSTVSEAAAQFDYRGPFIIKSASGKVTPALAQVFAWLRTQKAAAAILEPIKSIDGAGEITLKSLAGKPEDPDTLVYQGSVQPQEVNVQLNDLPAPVTLMGGTINVDTSHITANGVRVSLLDARAKASGTVSDYATRRKLQIDGELEDGVAGPKFVRWVWSRGKIPSRLLPKTPIRFAARRTRITLAPSVELQAAAQLDSGQSVDVNLAWEPAIVNVKQLILRDNRTNAVSSVLLRDKTIGAGFTGVIYGSTIEAILANPGEHIGYGSGDMHLIIDRDHPDKSTGNGHLAAENVNLAWLIGKPVKLDRIELEADSGVLRVNSAAVKWAEQPFNVRGEVKHDGHALVVDAQVNSPGIVVEALLPASGPEEEVVNPRTLDAKSLGWLWPLPVTGHVDVRTDFIEYKRYHIASVQGTLALEAQRMHLGVQSAELCGVSFPFVLELTPAGASASAHVAAQELGLQTTARCLTGERVLLSGRFDLHSDPATHGTRESELYRNLQGKLKLHAHDGKVLKAPVLGNILSMKNIARLFKNGPPKLGGNGFPYKTFDVEAHFDKGRFVVDQASLDSDALGLVATGSIGITDGDTQMTVLVAPFGSIDRLVRSVPLLGYIIGGTFTSVPVSVSGDIRNPSIVPLGASAVGSQLLGIVERTLKLPVKVMDLDQANGAHGATAPPSP